MSRDTIIAEISAERARQDSLFGGAEHDDRHSLAQWIVILAQHLGLAGWDGSPEDACHLTEATRKYDPVRYRLQFVRLAAVAVAALEAFDRRAPQEGEAAPAVAPEKLAWLRRVAADQGEPVLLMTSTRDSVGCVSECPPYATPESTATSWERQNAAARAEPPAPEAAS